MKLALPTMLVSTFAGIAFIQLFLGLSDGAVTCNLDGVCKDTRTSPSDGSTVCSNCKSCTFKNCCNKVYTSPYAKCPIPGWRANGYKGNVPVDIKAPSRKRDAGCSDSNRCPSGYKCVAYKKGNSNGFCWRGPQGDAGNSSFALAILIAGLVILL
ncbi:hypothetical protein GPALN_002224 [Globodera pallida]|nr:hypothetical protein GPALN_002221 [Globodera pallida]KAI3412182.1 hypothetical protein GPALN_002224 [Globodera pallida]